MFKKRLLWTVLFSQFMTSVVPVFASGWASGSGSGSGILRDSADEPAAPSVRVASLLAYHQVDEANLEIQRIGKGWVEPGEEQEEYRRTFHPTVLAVATDPSHPENKYAIGLLWNSGDDQQTTNRAELLPHLLQIAGSKSPRRWSALNRLWNTEDDQQAARRLAVLPALLEMAQNPADPDQWKALERLWYSNDAQESQNRLAVRSAMIAVAQNLDHKKHLKALDAVWYYSGEHKDQIRADLRPFLIAIAQSPDHPDCFDALSNLWNAGGDQQTRNRAEFHTRLFTIAQNPGDPNQWNAVWLLWDSKDDHQQANRKILRPLLLEEATHPTTQDQWDVLSRLWKLAGAPDPENWRALCPLILQIAQDPLNPKQEEAINHLQHLQGEEFKSYQMAMRKLLLQRARISHHPKQWASLISLLFIRNELPAENVVELYGLTQGIARDSTHTDQWNALGQLWKVKTTPGAPDVDEFYPFLLQTAQDPAHAHAWNALSLLWNASEDVRVLYRPTLRPILLAVVQDRTNPKGWDSLVRLWLEQDAHAYQDQATIHSALVATAQDPDSPYQQSAIVLLRESNDPNDQAIGLALRLQYLPLNLSATLEHQIDRFNQDTFKAHARPPLADLSEEPMDLVGEITALMAQIDAANTASLFYLEASAITGDEADSNLASEENHRKIQEIQWRVRGFLKTLMGQPLEVGETGGWQMYEENKPALINALKHIVKALRSQEDVATRLNNLGIVLNGILYCPTGQAEGINSAVNTLIYGQNRLTSDIEHRLHEIVPEAVYQTFLNAFHGGGGVHNMARARMVLQAHIGLSQAVEGFRERISHVHDREIPGILEAFYQLFSPIDFTTYVLNHVQTAADTQRIVNAAGSSAPDLRRQIQQDQHERPLLSGEIVRWLVDRGHQENLAAFGFDGEGNGVLTYEGAFEILKILGYLRG